MATPPRLIMFMVMSSTCMMRNTATMHSGIAREITRVAPQSRRNTNSTTAARSTPRMMLVMALLTARLIKSLWSIRTSQFKVGFSSVSRSRVFWIRWAVCTVFTPDCLLTERMMQGSPSTLAMMLCSCGFK